MRLVIPSVNYGDMLPVVLAAWARYVPKFCTVVVTAPKDEESQEVSDRLGVRTHITNAWYRDGAVFRKGAALNEAFQGVQPGELCLAVDADVVPFGTLPLDPIRYDPETIYGVPRFYCPDARTLTAHEVGLRPRSALGLLSKGSDREPVYRYTEEQVWEYAQLCLGYFQLYRAKEGRAFNEGFQTAGGYDGDFRKRFLQRSYVPTMHMLHLGGRMKKNWAGRALPRW